MWTRPASHGPPHGSLCVCGMSSTVCIALKHCKRYCLRVPLFRPSRSLGVARAGLVWSGGVASMLFIASIVGIPSILACVYWWYRSFLVPNTQRPTIACDMDEVLCCADTCVLGLPYSLYVRATRTRLLRAVRTRGAGQLAPRVPRTARTPPHAHQPTPHAHQPRACRAYRVPSVPRAVAPQAIYGAMGESVPHDPAAPPAAAEGGGEEVLDEQIDEADDDDE